MGADIRKAVFDGFPASQAIGCDIKDEFIQLGNNLWHEFDSHLKKDEESKGIRFITEDLFSIPDPILSPSEDSFTALLDLSKIKSIAELKGRVRYLFTHSVFHLFGEEKQAEMALKLGSLVSRRTDSATKSVIFGRHIGATVEEKGFVDKPPIAG